MYIHCLSNDTEHGLFECSYHKSSFEIEQIITYVFLYNMRVMKFFFKVVFAIGSRAPVVLWPTISPPGRETPGSIPTST